MRARAPVTRVVGQHVTVRTELVATDGSDLPPLEVTLRRTDVDLLDPTATPAAPVLAALAAGRGEDLVIEGPIDERAARGAADVARMLASWWSTRPVSVKVTDVHADSMPGDGQGIFFTRGVDSWSTLLDLLEGGSGDRTTHLIAVHHDQGQRVREGALISGHQRVADELGLPLVVLETTARTLLDPLRPWIDVVGPVLVSTGLVASARWNRLTWSDWPSDDHSTRNGEDPALIKALSTGGTEVVFGNRRRHRHERVAHVLGHELARSSLQVCSEGTTVGNCGRCFKCLLTMSELVLAGDPDPTGGFDAPLDPRAVRSLRPLARQGPLVTPLVELLAPGDEELRRAWADAWAAGQGVPGASRWGDRSPPGLAGPGVPERVAAGLRAGTGTAEAPTAGPLGWRPGAVPLRPAFADHDRVRALTGEVATRRHAWAVVEHHIREEARDGAQAGLGLRCQEAFGPGPCYLPGILWAHDEAPVLGPDAVRALLRSARTRLWWRDDGDLEPLRVVEAIEQGCLPLQVMPAGPAADLADALPDELAALVVASDDLEHLDLSPGAVVARLAPAVDHLLTGYPERDLMAGAYGA